MQRKKLSFEQYRRLDLIIFAVLIIVFETIVYKAATKWFPGELYTISLGPAIVALVIMRWDFFALLHALLSGLVYCILAEGTVLQFMCYIGGNLFCVFSVLMLKFAGKEKIRSNKALSALYAALTALFMQCGRAVVSFVMGFGLETGINFITTDVLSGVFAILIVIITGNLDGIFEDQKEYLLRVQQELLNNEGGTDEN